MKRIKLLLIFLVIGYSSNAQDIQKNMYIRDNQNMVLILNDEIIGSLDLLESIPNNQIEVIKVQKDKRLSSENNLFFDNEKGGIMLAKTDFDLKTKAQEELNEFFGLNPDTEIFVNGFLLEDKNYRIATRSISKIEIMEPVSRPLNWKVIFITIE